MADAAIEAYVSCTWGLASQAHLSEDHGVLWTSTGWRSVGESTVLQQSVDAQDMDRTTDGPVRREGQGASWVEYVSAGCSAMSIARQCHAAPVCNDPG